MTESSENLLNHILAKNPGMPRGELLSLIERKKQESHGLLSDEGALRLLAQQLAGLSGEAVNISDQRISSVQAGLSDATISGEILSMSQLREFQRSDGSVGKLVRVKLKDSSGQITCVLWDSTAEIVEREKLGNGSKLRLAHGYTRLGLAGEVEFHLGSRSNIEVLSRTFPTGPALRSAESQENAAVNVSPETVRVRIRKLQKSRGENGPAWALCENEQGPCRPVLPSALLQFSNANPHGLGRYVYCRVLLGLGGAQSGSRRKGSAQDFDVASRSKVKLDFSCKSQSGLAMGKTELGPVSG